MSYHDLILAECPNLQERADDAFLTSAETAQESLPAYEFLLTPENRRPITVDMTRGNNRFRRMDVIWEQRIVDSSDVQYEQGRSCEPGEQRGNHVETYDMDTERVISYRETIKDSELTRICEANEPFFARRLAAALDFLDRQTAQSVYAEIAAALGQLGADAITHFGLAEGADTLPVRTKDANGAYEIGAWADIQLAANLSGISNPIAFGGSEMFAYLQRTMAGCCANLGIDVLELYRQNGMAFGMDTRLASALGSMVNESLAMEIGSLQILTHTQYPGIGTVNQVPETWKFNILTPRGLPADVLVKNTCDGLDMAVFSSTKVITRPTELYGVGDRFNGVTGTFGVQVDNSNE